MRWSLLSRCSWTCCKQVTYFILQMAMVSVNFYISKKLFFYLRRTLPCVNVFFPVVSLQISKQNPSRWFWEVVMYLWYVHRIALFIEILSLIIVGCVVNFVLSRCVCSYTSSPVLLKQEVYSSGKSLFEFLVCFQLFWQMKSGGMRL